MFTTIERGSEKLSDSRNIWEELIGQTPGLVVFDLDGTLKGASDALKAGKPGLVSDECLRHLDEFKNLGWQIGVVTNQTDKGHVVAELGSRLLGYEAFPKCFTDREITVFGSGPDWPIPGRRLKDKSNVRGLRSVASWVLTLQDKGYFVDGMNIYMVGDRTTDGKYFDRLVAEVSDLGVNLSKAVFYKVPGSFDKLDKKIPDSGFSIVRVLANAVP